MAVEGDMSFSSQRFGRSFATGHRRPFYILRRRKCRSGPHQYGQDLKEDMTDEEFNALCDLAIKAVDQIDQIMKAAGTHQLMDIALVKLRDAAKNKLGVTGANLATGALHMGGHAAGAAGNLVGGVLRTGMGVAERLGDMFGGAAQAAADNYLPFGGLLNAAVQGGRKCLRMGADLVTGILSLSIDTVKNIITTMVSSVLQWIFQTGPKGSDCPQVDLRGLANCILSVLSMSPKYSLANLLAAARTMEDQCEVRNSSNLQMKEMVAEILGCVRVGNVGIGPLYGSLCAKNRGDWRRRLLLGGSKGGDESSEKESPFYPSDIRWKRREVDSSTAKKRAGLLADLCKTFDEIFYLVSGLTVLEWLVATSIKPKEWLIDSAIFRGIARGIGFIDRGASHIKASLGMYMASGPISWILTTRICPKNEFGDVARSKHDGECVGDYKASIYRCVQQELLGGDTILSMSRLAEVLPDFQNGKFLTYPVSQQHEDMKNAVHKILTCFSESSNLDIVYDLVDGMDRMLLVTE